MKKTILVVDDEPRNLKLARDVLEMSGYEVIEAENGKIGIEMAKSQKPDLILMDIMMPVMGGVEATGILKADSTTQNIPILALSSQAMKGDKERIIGCGCDDYLAKPFNIHELQEIIAELLSKSNAL